MISGIPDGYQLDRIGYPMDGDKFIGHLGVVYDYPDCDVEIQHPVAIVSPKAAWRLCRASNWNGEPLKARFRNKANQPWVYGILTKYRPGATPWCSSENRWYRVCETWRVKE
jgi:hypothetical protein